MELTPLRASELADGIYDVQDRERLKLFLLRPEFSGKGSGLLSAEVGTRLINTEDAFGLCALGRGQRENELFFVFRGSTWANYGADWASNARIGLERGRTGTLVHIGFNQIFSSLLPQLKDFLDKHPHISGPIHCIGHSLGGAVASLVADWIRSQRRNPVKLYTFGAPRVGLEGFARHLTNRLHTGNVYRVYHKTDPVPMIPVYPYRHPPSPGDGYHIPWGPGAISFAAHRIGHYVDSTRQCSWLALKGRPNPELGEEALKQWLSRDTLDNPADPSVWERINSAMAWVLRKISVVFVAPIQTALMGGLTLADRIALALRQGVDASKDAGFWVLRLMRRIMRLLGFGAIAETTAELTRELMRWVLIRLIDRMTQMAQRALRHLRGG
ncbi:lipase family protein [Marinimicrobium sp. C6131]|uniref:lipase family protein n=1 Tax=Marinimicrobium sp. C6131 TaxID=3022676 RepID=UPI00223E23DA|nr:lipase family protein [Marinimicrobium sp. C6131]UZJ45273.1 lipase family protein [Marinimicrobium sp. C6131]